MAYSRLVKNSTNIPIFPSSQDVTFNVGPRGGILLELQLIWRPGSYFNAGTSSEIARLGDIFVTVKDSNNQSGTPLLLYQQNSNDFITVPSNASWTWTHPHRNEFVVGVNYLSKLGTAASMNPQPIGAVTGTSIIVTASGDPATNAIHNLVVHAEFISFDTNAT